MGQQFRNKHRPKVRGSSFSINLVNSHRTPLLPRRQVEGKEVKHSLLAEECQTIPLFSCSSLPCAETREFLTIPRRDRFVKMSQMRFDRPKLLVLQIASSSTVSTKSRKEDNWQTQPAKCCTFIQYRAENKNEKPEWML